MSRCATFCTALALACLFAPTLAASSDNSHLLWTLQGPEECDMGMAVTPTGDLIAFNAETTEEFDPAGAKLWSKEFTVPAKATHPVVTGQFYVGDKIAEVAAVDLNGNGLWLRDLAGKQNWPEAFTQQRPRVQITAWRDRLYATADNLLVALRCDGSELWRCRRGDMLSGPAAVDADGAAYFLAHRLVKDADTGRVHKIHCDLVKVSQDGRKVTSLVDLGKSGRLVAIWNKQLYILADGVQCFTLSGKPRWHVRPGETPYDMRVGEDGTAYLVSTVNGHKAAEASAISPDGKILWDATYMAGDSSECHVTTRLLYDNGRLYFGTSEIHNATPGRVLKDKIKHLLGTETAQDQGFYGRFLAVDSKTGALAWECNIPQSLDRTPLSNGAGVIYAANYNGLLCAFRSD